MNVRDGSASENTAVDLYRKAMVAFHNGDFSEAVELSRGSLHAHASGEALAVMALSFAKLSDERAAIDTCRAALPFGPANLAFYEFFAEYLQERDSVVYEEVLRYGGAKFPANGALCDRLWKLLMGQGRNAEIEPVVRRLAEAAPSADHYHALAVACRIINKNEEGIAAARKAIELGANFGNAFANLGRLLYAAARHGEAAEAFEAALLAPNPDVSIIGDLVIALQLSRQPEKAAYWRRRAEDLGICVGGLSPLGGAYGDIDVGVASEDLHDKLFKGNAWYKDARINYFPLDFPKRDSLKEIIETAVFNGMPEYPRVFTRSSRLVTFGSCFARELQKALQSRNMPSTTLAVPQGLNNTFALRSFIEWCLTGRRADDSYWYDDDPELGAFEWEAQDEQTHYANMLKRADGIILTLGLAEVWRDKSSGGVFWRGIPRHIFDAGRHEIMISTPGDNIANLEAIIGAIRSECGDVPIILTVSPVPLNATFNDKSCIVADAASKSILRASVEMIMEKRYPSVYYWPSFEVVRWLGAHLQMPTFGFPGTASSARDVPRPIVDAIIDAFMAKFFVA